MQVKTYIAIDLKSFYASVECVERGYDPLNTNLVVADDSRTDKTICLAVSPALKSFGVPGRPRLFEVIQKVKEINRKRAIDAHIREFRKKSIYLDELNKDKRTELDYIVACPRMSFYMEYSTKIYNIYLKYISSEDIHVYSIDEVFMDVTSYLNTYKMTPKELAMTIIRDVLKETGITATAGIGTNMYLCKVAMDIVAKHMPADENGVRIAELDEMSYREQLWEHVPLTDFWRVGRGYEERLHEHGLYTMGDVARCSIECEDILYKEFGINAELLIDHAWGIEPTEIKDIRSYTPETKSLGQGQVLHRPYTYDETKIIVKEMSELLSLDLVDKNLLTDTVVIQIGYDIQNMKEASIRDFYSGNVVKDMYGRLTPQHAHGTIRIDHKTSSTTILQKACVELFERIADCNLLARRVNITFCNLVDADKHEEEYIPISLFEDVEEKIQEEKNEKRERNLQKALIHIKNRYGKNAILKGTNLEEGATTKDRNEQVGGHKS
ncbi:MAG: DNA methylase [Erysipelotrichaceae bacterium]|nr:DNA methylase [Erysipelotrichaceae bacterium]